MAAIYCARVTARKRGQTQMQPKRQPRAKAAVVQSQPWTGKRKRPAEALPQNKQHSNSRRSNGTDCGDEAGCVSDNHSDRSYGTATAGTGFSVEDARIAILNHSPQFKLHELTVEQEKVG